MNNSPTSEITETLDAFSFIHRHFCKSYLPSSYSFLFQPLKKDKPNETLFFRSTHSAGRFLWVRKRHQCARLRSRRAIRAEIVSDHHDLGDGRSLWEIAQLSIHLPERSFRSFFSGEMNAARREDSEWRCELRNELARNIGL